MEKVAGSPPSALVATHPQSSLNILSVSMKGIPQILLFALFYCGVRGGHYYNADGTPHDPYHALHLPLDPPPYPTYARIPQTSFSCYDKEWGYHADEETGCQVFHLCQGHLISSHICTNGTLFHPQFKVCDNFYNVRCGVPLEDL